MDHFNQSSLAPTSTVPHRLKNKAFDDIMFGKALVNPRFDQNNKRANTKPKKELSAQQKSVLTCFGLAFTNDTFNRGKHEGKKFVQVLAEDPQYIRFILESDMSESSLADDANNLSEWIANYTPPTK